MQSFEEDAIRGMKATQDRSAPEAVRREARGAQSGGAADTLLHLQRAVGNAGVVQLLSSEDDPHGLRKVTGGGGDPLDPVTRVQMESAIGADFSDVRVHTGTDAHESAKSLGAHAYTAGNDVVFSNGSYDPHGAGGQQTLAHELTHVVQQRSGPVDGTMTDSGVKVSDPSDSFEQAAVANAERVTAGISAGPSGTDAGVQREAVAVQRDADEEAVQGLFVQRDADGSVQREGEEDEEQS